jgi:protein-S-isoprenylcysteine O-methyltransferase Ste14
VDHAYLNDGLPTSEPQQEKNMLSRILALTYGVFCYFVFFATFLYAIGFIGNVFVPKTMDSGRVGTLGEAIVFDTALLALFAIQHSVMARPWFKRMWTRMVPEIVERSTYVLFASLCLALLFWQWKPIGGVIWQVDGIIGQGFIWAFYAAGWLIVLMATFLINHFDLFGLRQVWMYFQGTSYQPIEFQTPGFYRWVRHPLYVGWFFVFWSATTMTSAHLVFSVATTLYILLAIRWEERDLVVVYGNTYAQYQASVPMLTPWPRPGNQNEAGQAMRTR